MFFISGKCVTICDTGVVKCNDDCSVVCLFDCFEDFFVNFGCIDWFIFLFWANTKGTFGGESVVLYRCSGCVFDAAVTYSIFDIIILTSIFFVVVKSLVFSFVNITRSEMELCVLFFVVVEAVYFLNNAMFSLVWLLGLVVSAIGFKFWGSS